MRTIAQEPVMPLVEVVIDGTLDAESVPRVHRLLDEAADLRPWHLVVDLSRCPNLDAAGIDLLVQTHRRVWGDGGRLSLRGLSARLHRLLAIARVDQVLHTAAAPAGYQPRHRAFGRAAVTPATDATTSPADEVRWWEAVASS